MKKPLLLVALFSIISTASIAQDFKFGEFTKQEMDLKSYDKDTSAHAVVLNEHGRSEIVQTNDDQIRLLYEYHVKIKIFDKAAFDEGNIAINIYSSDGQVYEVVDNIKAVTTYTDDDGVIKKIALDPSKIYEVKETKHWSTKKFAMPGMRNGCTIEYSYRLESPYWEQFQPWKFQAGIPKVYSEYDIHIPAFWTYNASIRGGLKMTKNIAEIESGCFVAGAAKADCSHFVYGMANIPAFIEEADMTSPKNFLSAVYFELAEWTNPYNGSKFKVAKDWKDVDYELKHYEKFGGQIKRKSLLLDRITPVIAGKTDTLEKAKAIYDFVKKTIKWNEYQGFESEDGIRKALDSHTGSIGDINLTLVGALNAAGINTDAVLLSTREHGEVNMLYPAIGEFNYVVARVSIGNKSYLLDASEPLLPFGMLPLRCLNDQGRVMNLDKPSYWIDMQASANQKGGDTYVMDMTLQTDGTLKGTMLHYSTGYKAYEKRLAIKKFNSFDEYVENLDEKAPNVKILTSEAIDLDSLGLPLGEKYSIEIKEFNGTNHDKLLFNPFLFDKLVVNPFKLASRSYPVDWGMPTATRFTLTMHLPDGYKVENPPQDAIINLPNKGGSFITSFENNDNMFTFSHVIQFNKSIYSTEEYPYIKEFFNKAILSEKADMAFKKK